MDGLKVQRGGCGSDLTVITTVIEYSTEASTLHQKSVYVDVPESYAIVGVSEIRLTGDKSFQINNSEYDVIALNLVSTTQGMKWNVMSSLTFSGFTGELKIKIEIDLALSKAKQFSANKQRSSWVSELPYGVTLPANTSISYV